MKAIERCIQNHAFRDLFIEELGWDRFAQSLRVDTRLGEVALEPVAHKRGLVVFVCTLDRLMIRDRSLLRHVQHKVAALAHEHLIIYVEDSAGRQVWQWHSRNLNGRSLIQREHPFHSHNPPPAFLENLVSLRVTLEDEEQTSLSSITRATSRTFNRQADQPIFFRNQRFLYEGARLAAELATGGDEAFHEFINFHDALAPWMARRFRHTGIDIEDLEQMARMGLIHAARGYDPERETAFSTYASHWLLQSIMRHVPSYAFHAKLRVDQFWRYRKLRRRAELRFVKNGQRSVVRWFQRKATADGLIGKWVEDIEPIWKTESLEGNPEAWTATMQIPCTLPTAADIEAQRDEAKKIRRQVGKLDPRSALIICRRFGFNGTEYTLKEIGEELGITRERVRQLEADALIELAERFNGRKPRKKQRNRKKTPETSKTHVKSTEGIDGNNRQQLTFEW